jgi:hypothetical protein
MRRAVLLVLPLLAALAAGCGGATTTGAGTAPDGASIVPASAPVFVAIDTDRSSDQIEKADALLKKFPGREELMAGLNKALAEKGLNVDQVTSALGPELDIVVLDVSTNNAKYVGMTQPKDEQEFEKLLASGSKPAVHAMIGGWTVFSEDQASLDVFKAAQNEEKLADKASFDAAMAKLSDEAVVKGYVDGHGLNQALQSQLQGQVPGGLGGVDQLNWLGASLEAQDDGASLHFVANGFSQGTDDYTSELLDKAPQGALLFATFKGAGKQLQNVQGTAAAAFEQLLGMKLSEFAQLFDGETAVWVSPGTPIPEVTIVLSGDPKQSLATLDTLAVRLSKFAGGAQTSETSIDGVALKRVTFGNVFSVYYGEVHGKVLLTDTTRGVTDFRTGPSASLADDPAFKSAVDASGAPDAYGGFAYVNVQDAYAMISGLAAASGDSMSQDLQANIKPLRSAVLWSSADGDNTDFNAFLEIR